MTGAPTDIVLGCENLDAALIPLVEDHGWRLETIFPADAPTQMILRRGTQRLRLIRGDDIADPPESTAPSAVPGARLTAPVISRLAEDADFGVGRAGMTYRDLIPDRLGGVLIASHIRIDDEGPVADYVHFHDVAFQLIFCRRGWVEVAYQDQGPPLVMTAGDCVLQPPGIRHRVLAASAGLEVVELASPAVHATHRDHELVLPSPIEELGRDYGGQNFVHHVAADTPEVPSRFPGYLTRDVGLGPASRSAVEARVHRSDRDDCGTDDADGEISQDREWMFFFVLDGSATVMLDGESAELGAGDSVVVPPGCSVRWLGGTLLEVAPGMPREMSSEASSGSAE
jgi:quercetin dioxygenase-like cupin family protein